MAVHTKELSLQSQETELERLEKSQSTTAPSQDTEQEEEIATKATSPDPTLDISTASLEGSGGTRQTSVSSACFQSDAFT